ncbi:MAG: SDR family oxidoreductase [Bdellovibrionota bacterium]
MNCAALSIRGSFSEKSIFIVGGSGFIGKVWLSMMLDFIPNFEKIYILVRSSRGKSAKARFAEIYATSPVFTHLHNKYGPNALNVNKLVVLEGDVTLSKFGLSNADYNNLVSQVDVTLNFAADLRFYAPLDEMLKANAEGPLNVAKFILASKKSKLLHISTVYVAGAADGVVEESLSKQISPNGTSFSAEEEFNWAKQEGLAARSRDATNTELTNIGISRAQRLGWPTTYTYTKALGEILLSEKISRERLSIFRPSIVESAEKYPFPGWNEDFNGTAPYVQLLSSRYRVIVGKPQNKLDVIPVDYVVKGLFIATSALLHGVHADIYQSSTSSVNPLTVEKASSFIVKFYRSAERKRLGGFLFPYPKTRFVSPKHIFSGPSLRKIENGVSSLFEKISREKNSAKFLDQSGLKAAIRFIKHKAKLIESISKVYRPFIYDYNYTFKSDNLLAHKVVEEEFFYSPSKIQWDYYWQNIHIPGLRRWCLPQMKKMTGEKKNV